MPAFLRLNAKDKRKIIPNKKSMITSSAWSSTSTVFQTKNKSLAKKYRSGYTPQPWGTYFSCTGMSLFGPLVKVSSATFRIIWLGNPLK